MLTKQSRHLNASSSTLKHVVTLPLESQPRLRVVTAFGEHGDSPEPDGRRTVAVVAHAGLGISRLGGAPNRMSMRRAARLAPDAVEVDICASADGALVLHHDMHTRDGMPLTALKLRELRRQCKGLLTLDEGIAELSADTRLVLDLKATEAVEPLANWLLRRDDSSRMVVCSERVDALRALTLRAPSTQIWQTFPNIGRHAHERVARVVAGLLAHRGRDAVRIAGDVAQVLGRMHLQPADALARLAGVPWRRLLPRLMGAVRDDLGACGVAVHHASVTPDLCCAARELGLTVTAWTVNEPEIARRLAACGVDMITTDRVTAVRRVVHTRPRLVGASREAVG